MSRSPALVGIGHTVDESVYSCPRALTRSHPQSTPSPHSITRPQKAGAGCGRNPAWLSPNVSLGDPRVALAEAAVPWSAP
eukprot:6256699-Prymnesium_polylepis.1